MPRISDLPAATAVDAADLVPVVQGGVTKQATVALFSGITGGAGYNVISYGADPTGVSDSQAEIQAAIDAAEAAGGGLVYVPAGTYIVTSGDLVIDSDYVTLCGEGNVSIITFSASCNLQLLANNLRVSMLRIEGPGAGTQSTSENDAGILTKGTSGTSMIGNVTIDNCLITGFKGDGIHARYTSSLRIHDNTITTCAYAGIGCYSCADGVISNNLIADINVAAAQTNAYGISLSSYGTTSSTTDPICRRFVISGNTVSTVDNWTGIDMHGGDDVSITGNTVTACPFGIKVASHTINFNASAKRVSVTGNSITGDNTQPNIILRGAYVASVWEDFVESCTVSGNTCYQGGSNASSDGGIVLEGTKGVAVTGNSIKNPSRHGVVLYQQNYGFTVTGNICVDPSSATSSVSCGFVAIVGDYQTGFVGHNALMRGSLSASSVCTAHIVRSSGTFTNSSITFDYSYSQHTGSSYYTGTLGTYEWTNQRRSDSMRYTEALVCFGFTTYPTMTIYLSKVGDVVTIRFPVMTPATSNSATFSASALPAEFRPAKVQIGFVRAYDNSGTYSHGMVQINTDGTMQFGKGTEAVDDFTTSGTKAILGGSVSYSLY